MYYTKFTKFRPCLIILFCIILILNIISLNGDINIERHREILADLPTASDLDTYFFFLDRTLDFLMKYKYNIDPNINFAVLLSEVIISQILKEKRETLPSKLVFRLDKMLYKCSVLSNYYNENIQKYKKVTQHDRTPDEVLTIKLSYLNYNASCWQPLEKFNVELLKRTKIYDRYQLEGMYGPWITYAKSVVNHRMTQHDISVSDSCIANLVQLPVIPSTRRSQGRCNIRQQCKLYLDHGNDYGYGLTHRVLFLVFTKYTRNCAVFSEKEDKYHSDRLCSMVYSQCQYIALSEFAMVDLFAESIATCALLGHAQFLTNSWVKTIMMHQTGEGCFNVESPSGEGSSKEIVNETKSWSLTMAGVDKMNGLCTRHMTSLALAVVSNVVKYIIEIHY